MSTSAWVKPNLSEKGVVRKHGVHAEVVKLGEDGLLGDAEDAGDHAAVEGASLLVLETAAEPSAHEIDHLHVIAFRLGLDDWRIVLVNQDHHGTLVVLVKP